MNKDLDNNNIDNEDHNEIKDENLTKSSRKKIIFIVFAFLIVCGLFFYINQDSDDKNNQSESENKRQNMNVQEDIEKLKNDSNALPPSNLSKNLPSLETSIQQDLNILPDLSNIPTPTYIPPPIKEPKEQEIDPSIFEEPKIEEEIPLSDDLFLPPTPAETEKTDIPVLEKKNPQDREAQMQKWNTQMLVISGGGQSSNTSKQDLDNLDLSDPANLTLDNLDKLKTKLFGKKEIDEKAPLARTSSKQTVATYIGDDLNIIIAQGKIIKAVLETPIDTDFKGTLRAIIGRDVYGESGYGVLIPKGSRLIGNYSTTISVAQSRVDVNWTRLLMPNGKDININEPGVDRIGRIGVSGDVRTKFGMVLTSSILVNGIKLGSAYLIKKILGDQNIKTTKDKDGNEVTTESLSGKISRDAITETTDVISNYISQNSNTVPTINVPQGTILNVFVNQDLFIPNSSNDSNIIE